jgi:alanine racemase
MNAPKINRSAWTEINLSTIKNNYSKIKETVSPAAIIAMVKADAYGHGAIRVSKELEKESVDFFGVGTLDEARELRGAGVQTPIILFSPPPLDFISEIIHCDIAIVVSSLFEANAISSYVSENKIGKKIDALLTVDTGMGRIGFLENEFADVLSALKTRSLNFIGLFSHLSSADERSKEFTNAQIEKFSSLDKRLREKNINLKIKTLANSAGIKNYAEAFFSAVRPGLSLYENAMSVHAKIVHLKTVPKNTAIGYGREFVTKRESVIGTLPLGYADGVPKNLRDGEVLYDGKKYPIAGAICMDQMMVDLTGAKAPRAYDDVTLLGVGEGAGGSAKITASEIAKKSQTISYEILCRFGQRLPKVYGKGVLIAD